MSKRCCKNRCQTGLFFPPLPWLFRVCSFLFLCSQEQFFLFLLCLFLFTALLPTYPSLFGPPNSNLPFVSYLKIFLRPFSPLHRKSISINLVSPYPAPPVVQRPLKSELAHKIFLSCTLEPLTFLTTLFSKILRLRFAQKFSGVCFEQSKRIKATNPSCSARYLTAWLWTVVSPLTSCRSWWLGPGNVILWSHVFCTLEVSFCVNCCFSHILFVYGEYTFFQFFCIQGFSLCCFLFSHQKSIMSFFPALFVHENVLSLKFLVHSKSPRFFPPFLIKSPPPRFLIGAVYLWRMSFVILTFPEGGWSAGHGQRDRGCNA